MDAKGRVIFVVSDRDIETLVKSLTLNCIESINVYLIYTRTYTLISCVGRDGRFPEELKCLMMQM